MQTDRYMVAGEMFSLAFGVARDLNIVFSVDLPIFRGVEFEVRPDDTPDTAMGRFTSACWEQDRAAVYAALVTPLG